MTHRLDSLLQWLYGRINYERQSLTTSEDLRLQTMKLLMERLGKPHLCYPVIHVAGTKGKGSVSWMIGQVLAAGGRRVGVYSSPHLESINQRISVNANPIADNVLVETLAQLQPIANQIDLESIPDGTLRHLTFFELITASAFLCFANQNVDVVVLEVGMGGRLDSTNVCQPVVSVITNISLDHMLQLGSTIAKIAFEKAGIIKPGVPVISGAIHPEAAGVIQSIADNRNSCLHLLNRDFWITKNLNGSFDWVSSDSQEPSALNDVQVGMRGTHQQTNAALVLAVAQELNRQGWGISAAQLRTGLTNAILPGRTEIISWRPTVMLDIAHNPASIEALVETLLQLPEWKAARRKILLLAISKEKDMQRMVSTIVQHFDQVIFTTFECNPRSRDPRELQTVAIEAIHGKDAVLQSANKSAPQFIICNTSREAWERAREFASPEDFICVTGSAFLVADLRANLTVEASPIAHSPSL